ncbi:hypothetical protein [Rhodococcus qingshengii]|uniref:hypothetical protein n=1 Tax=Rhodococcus qingshengii TaxID=334542 RepID=UPI0022B499C6|nr:hypothetical protein [Rhodococcus qingshengii]MCZ4618447.1 hypothetical protein [Rhodococcus qingshengii]
MGAFATVVDGGVVVVFGTSVEVVVGAAVVDEATTGVDDSAAVLSALSFSDEHAASNDITTRAVAAAPADRPFR